MSELPDRLEQRGRPADPDFASEERLFRRVPRHDFIGKDGYVLPAGIRFPDISTNREKYSQPEDVLIDHGDAAAIAAARVGDIPEEIDGYEFRPVHDPLPDNYSHTEIRAFLDGEHLKNEQPSKPVKKKFRMSFRMKVIRRL